MMTDPQDKVNGLDELSHVIRNKEADILAALRLMEIALREMRKALNIFKDWEENDMGKRS